MPTILIVEDNEDIRLNLVEYLEFKNYQTDNTDDGLKALALTIVNKYDLIVLDVLFNLTVFIRNEFFYYAFAAS